MAGVDEKAVQCDIIKTIKDIFLDPIGVEFLSSEADCLDVKQGDRLIAEKVHYETSKSVGENTIGGLFSSSQASNVQGDTGLPVATTAVVAVAVVGFIAVMLVLIASKRKRRDNGGFQSFNDTVDEEFTIFDAEDDCPRSNEALSAQET